jgi:uncharacterized protein (TIGR02300 family)
VRPLIFPLVFTRIPTVAKPELGTKRLCGGCGAKFYDLSKDPIVCPKCSTVFVIAPVVSRSRPQEAAKAAVAPVVAPVAAKEPEVETVEPEGAEFVSLEEADAEATGKKKPEGDVPDTGEDVEVEDDESMDDAVFIEEQEEGDPDVTDIIGEGIEKEEET